jgi:hypothetical protein
MWYNVLAVRIPVALLHVRCLRATFHGSSDVTASCSWLTIRILHRPTTTFDHRLTSSNWYRWYVSISSSLEQKTSSFLHNPKMHSCLDVPAVKPTPFQKIPDHIIVSYLIKIHFRTILQLRSHFQVFRIKCSLHVACPNNSPSLIWSSYIQICKIHALIKWLLNWITVNETLPKPSETEIIYTELRQYLLKDSKYTRASKTSPHT